MTHVFKALQKYQKKKDPFFLSEKDIESATDSGYYHEGVHGRTTTDFDIRHVNGNNMNLRYCDWYNPPGVRAILSDSKGNEILRYQLQFDVNDWKDLGNAITSVLHQEVVEKRKKTVSDKMAREKSDFGFESFQYKY